MTKQQIRKTMNNFFVSLEKPSQPAAQDRHFTVMAVTQLMSDCGSCRAQNVSWLHFPTGRVCRWIWHLGHEHEAASRDYHIYQSIISQLLRFCSAFARGTSPHPIIYWLPTSFFQLPVLRINDIKWLDNLILTGNQRIRAPLQQRLPNQHHHRQLLRSYTWIGPWVEPGWHQQKNREDWNR